MEFTKKEAFLRQIAEYLRENRLTEAYDLSKDFVNKFPDEAVAHYTLGRASLMTERLEEAKTAARKAFNLANGPEDVLTCAILAASVYYRTGEYAKGYEILKGAEKGWKTDELERLLIIFSLEMKERETALTHFKELLQLNEKMAQELLARYTPPA